MTDTCEKPWKSGFPKDRLIGQCKKEVEEKVCCQKQQFTSCRNMVFRCYDFLLGFGIASVRTRNCKKACCRSIRIFRAQMLDGVFI